MSMSIEDSPNVENRWKQDVWDLTRRHFKMELKYIFFREKSIKSSLWIKKQWWKLVSNANLCVSVIEYTLNFKYPISQAKFSFHFRNLIILLKSFVSPKHFHLMNCIRFLLLNTCMTWNSWHERCVLFAQYVKNY